MQKSLEHRLSDALSGSVLEARLGTAAAAFLKRRSDDEAAQRLDGRVLFGLARVLASQPQVAGFLSHRPALLERIASANGATLSARAEELAELQDRDPIDLETALDELRITRHEETCLTACLDLGGVVRFEAVSHFLSVLAESITHQALQLALSELQDAAVPRDFSVVGMGKIGGREFTYHSDLDLIFLCGSAPESLAAAARLGPRLISYLGTMTGAGVAYAVDMRLRPSGNQGVLVTSFERFESYQLETAEIWEHMAMLRARAIAGQTRTAQDVLDRVREKVLRRTTDPWPYIAELRTRIENERGSSVPDKTISLKTGRGGQMDIDFLAKGGLLERRTEWTPPLPSVPAMLNTVVQGGRAARLLSDYRFVRLIESRARWIALRSVDEVRVDGDDLDLLAELVTPGSSPTTLISQLTAAQERIRSAYDSVIAASSISAIAE